MCSPPCSSTPPRALSTRTKKMCSRPHVKLGFRPFWGLLSGVLTPHVSVHYIQHIRHSESIKGLISCFKTHTFFDVICTRTRRRQHTGLNILPGPRQCAAHRKNAIINLLHEQFCMQEGANTAGGAGQGAVGVIRR